jgi:cytochrome c-type biogenesis protein CcmE
MGIRQKRRLILIFVCGALCALAVGLIGFAMRDTLVFFRTPTQIVTQTLPIQRMRIGGLVLEGSVQREGTRVRFHVTDRVNSVVVDYAGLLPDLFREGQGVVVEGKLDSATKTFRASSVLARHDEQYMPKEVAEALKQSGQWKGVNVP